MEDGDILQRRRVNHAAICPRTVSLDFLSATTLYFALAHDTFGCFYLRFELPLAGFAVSERTDMSFCSRSRHWRLNMKAKAICSTS